MQSYHKNLYKFPKVTAKFLFSCTGYNITILHIYKSCFEKVKYLNTASNELKDSQQKIQHVREYFEEKNLAVGVTYFQPAMCIVFAAQKLKLITSILMLLLFLSLRPKPNQC